MMVVLATLIGLYPLLYLIPNTSNIGLLSSKADDLLNSSWWMTAFYLHILPGGLALLIGWPQFVKKFRKERIGLHRSIGKVYVLAILISGLAGLYLAVYANGGPVAKWGFGGLAAGWLLTTGLAYLRVREKKIAEHQMWMIRSYALCLAAVTLRLWLPLFTGFFKMEFLPAYRIIAWLCWVPNLLFAEWLIFIKKNKKTTS
jgi:hypothetical protein